MNSIIIYYPFELSTDANSASKKRPKMMLKAFQNSEYDIFEIIGNRKKRKGRVKELKNKLKEGKKFQGCYIENATIPMVFNEPDHFPRYPFLDINFYRLCMKEGIKIGYYYRDIHWRFSHYKKTVNLLKRLLIKPFYYMELMEVRRFADIVYVPNAKMGKYIPLIERRKIVELPPGLEKKALNYVKNKRLKLLYVGGFGTLYECKELFKSIKEYTDVELIVNTRKKEWELYKDSYEPYLCERITIMHETNLEQLYKNADICVIFIKKNDYWEFALPYKLFEYIENYKPIISSSMIAVSRFINEKKIGYSCDYDKEQLIKILKYINLNRDDLKRKIENIKLIYQENSWEERAMFVMNNYK